jgi:hypothetical protein
MDQRICRLSFSAGSGGINAVLPANPNLCPPGYYMLFIVNKAGIPSISKTLRVRAAAAPAAPGNLTATPLSSSSIGLRWTSNSTDEVGFEIERLNHKRWEKIGTVGAAITTFVDFGLRRNTTNFYRVRAFNSIGQSAYSNTASARTLRR